MERLFVTGGSGFIGSHLVEQLCDMKYQVTNYDLKVLPLPSSAAQIEGDIMNYERLSSAMKGHSTVLHLAAMVGVVNCLNNEAEVYRINYEGVKNVAGSCIENGIGHLIFASSSEVYGDSNEILYESNSLSPKSAYGYAKMNAENLLKEYADKHGLKVTVLRYCNIYGERQRIEFAIPIFIRNALNGERIPICNQGEQVRNFTYVKDAVAGTIEAIHRAGPDFDVFNISSSDTLKIMDVAKKIINLNENSGDFEFVKFEDVDRLREFEIITRMPSTKKASEALNFRAATSFDEGLQFTYNYYKKHSNNVIYKFLVTGGAGFIGSHIVKRLVDEGYFVRVLDNLSTGKLSNLEGYAKQIEFLLGDLTDPDTARKAVEGIDYVIHQAAIPSVALSIDDPLACHHSIVTSTVNLLKASADSGTVKRVVQASSSAVYGETAILPHTESMIPLPMSPYAAAKLAQEHYASVFYNVYGLQVMSLRYFNVFGPLQDADSIYSAVIAKFVKSILDGVRPTIYGDGSTSRDFIYVENIVEANLRACFSEWNGKADVINIGSGKGVTLNQLVDTLCAVLNSDLTPDYKDYRPGDIKHSISDISRAEKVLGFAEQVDFYHGIEKLVQWHKVRL